MAKKSIISVAAGLVFLSSGFSVSAAYAQQEQHAMQFEFGCKQMQAKHFSEAIALLTESIATVPKDSLAIFRRGQCFFCIGKYDDAMSDFDRAIDIDKDVATFYVWRGTAQAKQSKDQLAIRDYLKAMRLDPGLVSAYNDSRAKGGASSSIPDANNDASANSSKKKVSTLDVGHSDKAVDDYAEAVRRASIKATAYFRPGTVFSGIYEVGTDGTMLGFKVDSRSDGTVTTRDGVDYFSLDGNEKNLREIDDEISEHPERAELYYARGRLLEQLGWVEMSLDALGRAIDLDRNNVKYTLARAFLYHHLQKDELANSDVRRAADLDPDLPDAILFPQPKTPKSE